MADNKSPWRDIYSVAGWDKILKLTNNSGHSDYFGITRHIEQYHGIRKDVLANLPARRQSLLGLEQKCIDFVTSRELSTDKSGKKKYNDRAIPGNQYITEIGPWLMSLARRCEKKYDYLKILEDFERNNKNAEHSGSAASYLKYLNKVQKSRSTDTNMHLTAGNRMERIDPVHRGGAELELFGDNYVQATSNPLSQALVQWLEDSSTTPFFLWLETQPICVATPGLDDKWSQSFRTITKTAYVPKGEDIYLVSANAGQLWRELADSHEGTAGIIFDTSDARLVKGSVAQHPRYAFAWSTDDQIYSAPHKAGTFHHSSFTRGYKVKAAGMLGVSQGKVTYVDDDTGHYHTDAFHLYSFCEFLQRKGVLAQDAGVRARTLPSDEVWPIRLFLERYRDPATREELKANIKVSDIKVPGKGFGAATAAAAASPAPADPNNVFSKMAAFKPPVRKPLVKKKDD